ncbi:hypothetical protein A2U01_0084304, partial [Trifolium medium]|nr:hypothetical protein [Trifolium medium]
MVCSKTAETVSWWQEWASSTASMKGGSTEVLNKGGKIIHLFQQLIYVVT